MEEKDSVIFLKKIFYIFGVVLIYCMDVIFLELFLFVYYCDIVYEKFVLHKIGNPNRANN